MNKMKELKFDEVSLVSGGHCDDGLVDATTLVSNVGCVTQAQFDQLEAQLFSADQEPPLVAFTISTLSTGTFFSNARTGRGFRSDFPPIPSNPNNSQL